MVAKGTHTLLEYVIVECLNQVGLVSGSITGFRIYKEISSILEIDNEVFLSRSLGPPQKVVDLILLGNVVSLRVGILLISACGPMRKWNEIPRRHYQGQLHHILSWQQP